MTELTAVICKRCQSNDMELSKDGKHYVCQSCRTKYTIEKSWVSSKTVVENKIKKTVPKLKEDEDLGLGGCLILGFLFVWAWVFSFGLINFFGLIILGGFEAFGLIAIWPTISALAFPIGLVLNFIGLFVKAFFSSDPVGKEEKAE